MYTIVNTVHVEFPRNGRFSTTHLFYFPLCYRQKKIETVIFHTNLYSRMSEDVLLLILLFF